MPPTPRPVMCADDYYESLDIASLREPQSLLCDEMYGAPLDRHSWVGQLLVHDHRMEAPSRVRPVGVPVVNRLTVLVGAAAVMLAPAGWFVVAAETGTEVLRSEHSRPGVVAPPPVVAVTPRGKLYHKPGCAYIHRPAHLDPGAESVADGYTPCARCLKP